MGSNGSRPCAAGARRRGRQGQTGVWGGFPGGSGEAASPMKRRAWKAEPQTFLEVGGGLSAVWVSAFAFSGSCSLTAGVDFPQQHRERTAEQPVWALSPPKDGPATTECARLIGTQGLL